MPDSLSTAPKASPEKPVKRRRTGPLTATEADFLYGLYECLYHAPLSLHGKYRTFETAAVDIYPWPITHISAQALSTLVAQGSAKGLRRGHRMQRKVRAEWMFGKTDGPRAKQDLLAFFLENDKVTLVTQVENTRHDTDGWSEQISMPDDILVGGSYSVLASRKDLNWAREMLARLNAISTGEDDETH